MSEENVAAFTRGIDALNGRDLDAFLELIDGDAEVAPRLVAIEGSYRGHEGIRRWWKSLFDAFPDYRVEAVDVRDEDDVTVADLRWRGHGAGSAAPFDETIWSVARWRDRKLMSWRVYENHADAREAAGLSE